MKWALLTCAVTSLLMMFCIVPARADCALLEDETVRLAWNGTEQTREGVIIRLTCRNKGGQAELIRFLIPRSDGKDTVFGNRWTGEEAELPPGEDVPVELTILKPEGGGTPETVSFRVAFRGRLSVPLLLDCD